MDIEKKEQVSSSEEEIQRRAVDKEEAKVRHAQTLRQLGNLNAYEIQELVELEFDKEHQTIDDQIRRYYLKLKSEKPERAAQMFAELEGFKLDETIKEDDIKRICGVLSKYWSGFVIHHNGKIYT